MSKILLWDKGHAKPKIYFSTIYDKDKYREGTRNALNLFVLSQHSYLYIILNVTK